MPQDLTVYTLGHSDHELAAFLGLLRRHSIALVVDVRSQPYSRWASQFNREALAPRSQEASAEVIIPEHFEPLPSHDL